MSEPNVFLDLAVLALGALYVLTVAVVFSMTVRASLGLVRALWLGWILAVGTNAFIGWGAAGLSLAALALLLAPAAIWVVCNGSIFLAGMGGARSVDQSSSCQRYRLATAYWGCLFLLMPLPSEDGL